MTTTSPSLAPQRALPYHPALHAHVVDQISRTVHQLVLAALERAAQAPAPAGAGVPLPPPASLPLPVPALLAVALSAREREVLGYLVAGESNKVIARALSLSTHTVKRHVANILDKLELRSRGQAAAWWLAQQRLQDRP